MPTTKQSSTLHTSTQAQDQVEGGLLLDVVIRQSPPILQLLSGEDQPLLVRRDALLVLDLGLDIVNGVAGLDIQGDGLAGQGLHKDLHTSTQAQDQVEGGLLLDIVIRQSPPVLQLLSGEDQPLLVRRDALLVLDLGLDIVNGVAGLDIQGDGLASQGLHKDLHTSTQAQDQVEGGLLLDVVIRQSPPVLQLLSGEDQPLLVRRDALLVLNLGLDIVNGVAGLDIQGDGLASQGLHKDLHTSTQAQDQVEGGLLLDVVIRQSPPVLQLLSGKDQPLLVRRDALLVLDLGLDIVNGVAGLDIQGDGLAGQGLHKDLHTSTQAQDQVEGGLLLDVVIRQSPPVLQLLSGKDQPLLVRRDALLVLDLGLDIVNGVAGLDIQGDGLAGQGLHKDLHTSTQAQDQVEGGLLLDVVIRQSPPVLQLLSGEDQPLLVRRDALLVLNLGLDIVNGVAGLDIQGDGLASQGLHKDLHGFFPIRISFKSYHKTS